MQRISPSDLHLPSAPASHAQESAATPADDSCPICEGVGWLAEKVPGSLSVSAVPCTCRLQAHQQRAEREEQARRILLLSQLDSELGGKLSRCTLENYRLDWAIDAAARESMEQALSICLRYTERPAGWLYLHGPTGIGKSHLASATARRLAHRLGVQANYTTEPGLMSFLRAGWGKSGAESTEARMSALQNTDLLVIDDLGTAFRGKGEQAWVDAQLFELLQPRYLNTRMTILTSNLPPGDLEPRLSSRIKGEAIEIKIDNTDQREVRRG